MTPQLFAKENAPRSRPVKRMHVIDAGSDHGHVHMQCGHCGYDDGWKVYDNTLTELKQGLPCPHCNLRALVLHVKDEYYQDVKEGRKPFEFRLDNEYWRKRLVGQEYDVIIYMSGYPKKGDTSKTMTFPYHGYEMQTITHKHFGPEPVTVFAIAVGGDQI